MKAVATALLLGFAGTTHCRRVKAAERATSEDPMASIAMMLMAYNPAAFTNPAAVGRASARSKIRDFIRKGRK